MESKILTLYGELRDITAGYMIYQDRNIVSEILRKIPQIQEFILWFVEKNRLPVNETDFLDMRKAILDIMKDIVDAIEIGDIVLLNDDLTKRTIRVYIVWNDDGTTSNMTNEEDTQSTKQDTPALLYTNISFTQIAE